MTAADATLTVALVTYNSADVVAACLESLPAGMEGIDRYEVVVADNASTDGTVAEVARAAPQAKVLELTENRGYAAAINAVTATVSGGPVLVLNPDARLHPGSVRHLLRALDRPGVGIAVPKIVDANGHLDPSLRRDTTVGRTFGEAVLGGRLAGRLERWGEVDTRRSRYEREGQVDWASGAALLVSAECLAAVGPWDESFFMYSEEVDFALRARDSGFHVWFTPEAVVTHLRGEGSTSPALRPLMMRNRLALYRRRHGAARATGVRLGLLLNEGLRAPRSAAHRAAFQALLAPGAAKQSLRAGTDPPAYVCFAGLDWWYHSRAHNDFQLMVEAARTRQVLVVNSIGTRIPVRGRSTMPLRRITRKARSIAKFLRQPLAERPGLHVMTPLSVPILESDRWRRFNAALVRAQVKLALRHLGIRDPVVVVTVPTAWDVVRDLPRRCTIYNRADKHSLFGESDQRAILELEAELLSGANYVVYATRSLMAEESDLVGDRGVLLDHGVDLDHFRRRPPAEEPDALRAVPHPRVGYIGAIRDYVTDLDLLRHVAKSLPDAQLVIIGDSLCEIDDLVALPNVHWLGFKPYEDIPRYGSAIDVSIMPFLDNDWIRYANPIKLKECLALGLPIVTTPFGDAQRYTSVLTIATDREEFVDAVRRALADGGQADRDERRASVRDASWLGRSRCLIALAERGERPA